MEGKDKDAIKESVLKEMSTQIDELLDGENPPKDLYELEKAVSELGNELERKVIEAIEEYKRKGSKKKDVRNVMPGL
jgi:hypothetical protein